MKIQKIIYLISAILITGNSFAQKNEQLKEGVQYQKTLKFNSDIDSKTAINLFSNEYKLGKGNTFVEKTASLDKTGITHTRQQQFYKGIKVEFGMLITHIKDENVQSINGELYNAEGLNLIPSINKSKGLDYAIIASKGTKFLWDSPEDALAMDYKKPEGEMVIFPIVKTGDIRLAYKFDVYSIDPISREEIYVDAHSGEILFKDPIIKHANQLIPEKEIKNKSQKLEKFITGNAATRYSGSQPIETSLVAGKYVLNEATRGTGNGIVTYNSARTVSYPTTNFMDVDNNWTAAEFANANKDNAALDAHWGAEKTYDFWFNTFARNSYDNLGAKIKSYVHYRKVANQSLFNAFWNGSVMSYGDGDTNPLTSIDVCGHEIGHAVCTYTAGLAYQNQSGAMNEGFSDIWGACIEQYGRTGSLSGTVVPAVWQVGEDFTSGGLRSMSNPILKGDPSTYLGTNWVPTADEASCVPGSGNDTCGVHTNSGVLNKWFFLMSVGEVGTNNAPVPDNYNVIGIGMLKAAEIAYFTERDYLTSNSTYADARAASLDVASNLYCSTSQEYISVKNAWHAVNVGEQYVAYPTDVALKSVSNSINVACGATINPSIVFRNAGSNVITSVNVSYSIDGGTSTSSIWNGSLAICNTQTFSFPIATLSVGTHILSVTITTSGDGDVTNNTKSSIIVVNSSEVVNSTNTFENTSDNLISIESNGNSNSIWERGTLGTKTFLTSASKVYATKLSGNYADKTKSYLFSKCYDLSNVTSPKVEFDMAFDLEQDYDLLYVQTSNDGGVTWTNLGTGIVNNWYNSNRLPNNVDCQNCIGGQWTGKDTVIKNYNYSLTQNANTILRFVMETDDGANADGVIIDNFRITGAALGTIKNDFDVFAIYPNPSNGSISISLSTNSDVKVNLNDISGRLIFNETFKNSDLIFKKEINFSNLSKGVYLINVASDGKNASKKLIIE
jgi:bacillolysin